MIPQSVRDQIRKEAEEKYPENVITHPEIREHSFDLHSSVRQAHIEAAEAMWIKCNGWIPVIERLPEHDVWVLTFSGDVKDDFQFDIGCRSDGKWSCLGWNYPVTHWKPLPPSPHE